MPHFFLFQVGQDSSKKKMIDGAKREIIHLETVYNCEWFTKFKKGEIDLEDKPHNSRSQTFGRNDFFWMMNPLNTGIY